MIDRIFVFVLAYLAAVPMTSLVSLDMRETEWLNILTYLWIGFGWVVWIFIMWLALFVCAIVIRLTN